VEPAQKRSKVVVVAAVEEEAEQDQSMSESSPYAMTIEQLQQKCAQDQAVYFPHSIHHASQLQDFLMNGYTILNEIWKLTSRLLRKLEDEFEEEDDRGYQVSPRRSTRTEKKRATSSSTHMAECVEMHKMIYDLCILPESAFFEAQLYELYSSYLKTFLLQQVLPLLKSRHDNARLTAFVHIWSRYKQVLVSFCAKIFSYLERFYVSTSGKRSLRDEGSYQFKEHIFLALKDGLRLIILENIKNDRMGHSVDRYLLRDALNVFVDMGLGGMSTFETEFECYAIQETKEFYHQVSAVWVSEYSLTEYMIKIEYVLQEETKRLNQIFLPSVSANLQRICYFELLKDKIGIFMDMNGANIEALINNEKTDDISRLYRLMSHIDGELEPLSDLLTRYVIRIGGEIFTKCQDQVARLDCTAKAIKALMDSYVIEILDFYYKVDSLVVGPFKADPIFLKALSQGFKEFVDKSFSTISTSKVKVAQLLSFYCDDLLRKKEERLEDRIERVVKFVQFSNDQDLFFEEYRKQFAQRLLSSSSFSGTEERGVISKLKAQFRGVGDVYKLEKMLSDKELASEMKLSFEQYVEGKELTVPYDLSVSVLTTGSWPITVQPPIRLPKDLLDAQNVFVEFYNSKFSKRSLKWAYSKGFIQLEGLYSSGKKLFELSTHQTCVLLMYNRANEFSVAEMMEETGIPLDEIQNTVVSLSTKSCKVLSLTKGDKSKSKPTPDTTFSLNEDFEHKLHKIKIPTVRITDEEVQTSQITVSQDRVCILDAAIVRTMKTRKVITMNQLITEIISQVKARFNAETKQIKKRIESLMEREYMQRSSDGQTLEYLA